MGPCRLHTCSAIIATLQCNVGKFFYINKVSSLALERIISGARLSLPVNLCRLFLCFCMILPPVLTIIYLAWACLQAFPLTLEHIPHDLTCTSALERSFFLKVWASVSPLQEFILAPKCFCFVAFLPTLFSLSTVIAFKRCLVRSRCNHLRASC